MGGPFFLKKNLSLSIKKMFGFKRFLQHKSYYFWYSYVIKDGMDSKKQRDGMVGGAYMHIAEIVISWELLATPNKVTA